MKNFLILLLSAVVGLIGVSIVLIAFYLGGYNFDHRGGVSVTCFITSLIYGGIFSVLTYFKLTNK